MRKLQARAILSDTATGLVRDARQPVRTTRQTYGPWHGLSPSVRLPQAGYSYRHEGGPTAYTQTRERERERGVGKFRCVGRTELQPPPKIE